VRELRGILGIAIPFAVGLLEGYGKMSNTGTK
jgi:hypothetical protein